jgi:hypothetical protein
MDVCFFALIFRVLLSAVGCWKYSGRPERPLASAALLTECRDLSFDSRHGTAESELSSLQSFPLRAHTQTAATTSTMATAETAALESSAKQTVID